MNWEGIRWSVLGIVVAIAGSGLYLRYQDTRPCVHPIPYSIGPIDARFEITREAVARDAESAANIWNKAAGKTVFLYDPGAKLAISLVYDEREANAKLGSEIALRQADADAARTALESAQTDLATRQAAYSQTVASINARGGASRSEAAALDSERMSLNQLADSINRDIEDFNASIAALNAQVSEFNQLAGHTFKEGEYARDSTGERITIFEFVGNKQLERVLAHEFGHAIGLDHNNDDPKSIMYAKNESGNLAPTSADLAALTAVCGS